MDNNIECRKVFVLQWCHSYHFWAKLGRYHGGEVVCLSQLGSGLLLGRLSLGFVQE